MMPRRLLYLLVSVALGCNTPQKPPDASPPAISSTKAAADSMVALEHLAGFHIDAEDPVVLVFSNGDTLATGLAKFNITGKISDPLGRTWLLCMGGNERPFNGGTSLYVLSAGDSAVHAALQAPWHAPGRLMEAGTGKNYYEAEVFAGEVLKDTIGVVWYERALMPDGQWKLNTTLLDLNGIRPDTMVFFGHGRKSTTMGLAFNGKCQILDSLNQRLK